MFGVSAMLPALPALALHAIKTAKATDAVLILCLWGMCLQCMMTSALGSAAASSLLLLIQRLAPQSTQAQVQQGTPFVQVLEHLCDAAVKLMYSISMLCLSLFAALINRNGFPTFRIPCFGHGRGI